MSYALFQVSLSCMDGERDLKTLRQQIETAVKDAVVNTNGIYDVDVEIEPVESAGVALNINT